jgi:hypothetical protein
MSKGLLLLINDNQGIFIPQTFAEKYGDNWFLVNSDALDIVKEGPNHPQYWDAWSDVLDDAYLRDNDGNRWKLWQDGDLWMVCNELMTDAEYENFFGEEREKEDERYFYYK